jgi:hypothetical protein
MTRLGAGGQKNPGSIPSMGKTFASPKHVQTDTIQKERPGGFFKNRINTT